MLRIIPRIRLEAGFGALLALELAAPFEVIVRRVELDLLGDGFLGVGHQLRQAAVFEIEFHAEITAVHVAVDRAFARLQLDLRELRERHQRAAARRQDQVADGRRAVARFFREAHGNVVGAVPDEQLAHRTAADPVLDQVGDVGDVDPVPCRRLAIDLDGNLGEWWRFLDQDVGRAGHRLERLGDVVADPAQLGEIVAVDPDRKVAVRLEYVVLHAVDDRLAESDLVAGQLGQALAHAADQVLLGLATRPGGVGPQRDAGLDMRRRPGIGAVIVAAHVSDHLLHLGKFEHRRAQLGVHLRRLGERDAARHLGMQPDRAFVELGQELAPDRRAEHDHGKDRRRAQQIDDAGTIQCAPQRAPVPGLDGAEHPIVEHALRPAVRQIGQARHQQ